MRTPRGRRVSLLTCAVVIALCMLTAIGRPAAAGTNDYPYAGSSADSVDQWGFYTRECTSFVAWRMVHNNGVTDFSNSMRGGHWGNAYEWAANASRLGYRVDSTPAVGAIAYWGPNQGGAYSFGHVAWVESVNGDGSVNVEEYNFRTPYGYGTRANVRATSYIHVRDIVATTPTPVSVRITNQPAPNQWYTTDISVSWQVSWGSCGSGTWSQEWDTDPANTGAVRFSAADGFTLFSYMGPSWRDGMHTHYVRWWACGASDLVAMGPYGSDRTPPSIAALSFDANGHGAGSTVWGPITIHGGMTDGASGPASLRLDVLHDGAWDEGRAGVLSAANGWTSVFDPAGIAPQDIRIHGWGSDNVGNSTNNFGALWLTIAAGPPTPAVAPAPVVSAPAPAPVAPAPAPAAPVVPAAPIAPAAPAPTPVQPTQPNGITLQPRPAPLAAAPFPVPPAEAYHASWAGQSAYPTVAPSTLFEWTVAFRNTGSAGWYRGYAGAHANIGTAGPLDSDYAERLGMDPGNWQAFNRIASQTTEYVGPGQVAWFTVQFRAPATPGVYRIPIRPVIDGATWLEDFGVFLVLYVSN
jgi:surface antigen